MTESIVFAPNSKGVARKPERPAYAGPDPGHVHVTHVDHPSTMNRCPETMLTPGALNTSLAAPILPLQSPPLASPTVMTLREYYRDRRVARSERSLIPSPTYNGRLTPYETRNGQSSIVSPSILAASLALVNLSSSPTSTTPTQSGPTSARSAEGPLLDLGTKLQESRRLLLEESDDAEALGLESPLHTPIVNPLSPRLLGSVPYAYTHERLQKYGGAYLGNHATADAFVKAVPLLQPGMIRGDAHMAPSSDGAAGASSSSSQRLRLDSSAACVVRVRVRPHGHSHRPFLLQKKFNIAALSSRPRSAAASSSSSSGGGGAGTPRCDGFIGRRRSAHTNPSPVSPLSRATTVSARSSPARSVSSWNSDRFESVVGSFLHTPALAIRKCAPSFST
ncbi:MAG: hypothetical protein M1838_001571 [Thelocarpon superellum]|nr:MAG: hypothetical protein M1838_001571 [Thelocarpon superellum]